MVGYLAHLSKTDQKRFADTEDPSTGFKKTSLREYPPNASNEQ